MLEVLITGATGMLGRDLKRVMPYAHILQGRKHLDLSSVDCTKDVEDLYHYDTIIHTAAFTDLQYSEDNPEKAYHLHADIIPLLQSKCNKLVYISAQGKDYDKIYFKSKLKGEEETLKRSGDLVIRTNIYGNGGLVKWALEELKNKRTINGYTNVLFNPVSTRQLSSFIVDNYKRLEGIINIGSSSKLSKYDFIKILALAHRLDTNLIKPLEISNYLDLTVESDKYNFNLIDGILQL